MTKPVLPGPLLPTRWVKYGSITIESSLSKLICSEHERTIAGQGWNPKALRLRNDLHLVDTSAKQNGGISSFKLAVIADHPFLKLLEGMVHVPRAVKAIYRKSNRLKYLRATNAFTYIDDMNRAEHAWRNYDYEKYAI